jgi:hypothetical protein
MLFEHCELVFASKTGETNTSVMQLPSLSVMTCMTNGLARFRPFAE